MLVQCICGLEHVDAEDWLDSHEEDEPQVYNPA